MSREPNACRVQPVDAAIAAWFGVSKVEPERSILRDRMAAAVGAFLAADPKVEQIIYALERAEEVLKARANALDRTDYSAEFFTEDADRMREAIELLKGRKA